MTGFNTIAEIRAANKAIGHHWFDRDTMAFFKSKIVSGVLTGPEGHRYFISRETNPAGLTMFSIRKSDDTGAIETVGEFHSHPTIRAAKLYLRMLFDPAAFIEWYEGLAAALNPSEPDKMNLLTPHEKMMLRDARELIADQERQP